MDRDVEYKKIKSIFMEKFNGQMNLITSTEVAYGRINQRLVYEISSGRGIFDSSTYYGVTILDVTEAGEVLVTGLDECFESLDDAEEYIKSLTDGGVDGTQ